MYFILYFQIFFVKIFLMCNTNHSPRHGAMSNCFGNCQTNSAQACGALSTQNKKGIVIRQPLIHLTSITTKILNSLYYFSCSYKCFQSSQRIGLPYHKPPTSLVLTLLCVRILQTQTLSY